MASNIYENSFKHFLTINVHRRENLNESNFCFCCCFPANQLDIYRIMLSDKKYGLSVNMMATRVMPSLLPQTVNPSLNLEQFMILLEVSGSLVLVMNVIEDGLMR